MDTGKKVHFFYKTENGLPVIYRGRVGVGVGSAGTGRAYGHSRQAKTTS